MKAIVVLAFMPLVVFGGWKVTELKGDELKGTSPCRAFTMANNTGSIVLWDKLTHDRPSISLVNKHMFNYKITRIGIGQIRSERCLGRVGIYDENKKLVKKGNVNVEIVPDSPNQGVVLEPKVIGNSKDLSYVADQIPMVEIYDALCHDGWSVRIVADTYGSNPDFDVTVVADDAFKSIPWIPSNKERVAQEKQRALKDAEDRRIKAETEKKKKEADELKSKMCAQINSLEKQRSDLERKVEFATKKGYLGAVKKYKAEISKLDEKIEKLKSEL